jgi:predicted Rossmann fold flavoprotein
VPEQVDIAVIGAGAAGLMAAIWAARSAPRGTRIITLDGARKLGAKILVAGGGRCNVTHDVVDESAYAGSSRHSVRNVLRRFDVPRTVAFFRELGVEVKREDTGKLFPVTDDARTVLDALLIAVRDAGVTIIHPWRVDRVMVVPGGFQLAQPPGPTPAKPIIARRVILATGGRSLPRTGSDGRGYDIARSLGHSVTRTFPGLVPLILPEGHFIRSLSGLTVPATLELRSAAGKRLVRFTDSTLCTHFGLSGPSVLDISRHCLADQPDPPHALFINWLPERSVESLDADLAALKNQNPGAWLSERMPDRLARALCAEADVDPTSPGHQLTRDRRRALARAVCDLPLPVTGDRGFNFAEVTAGGIPLSEVRLETMESRVCPGLHLCGEILDVDGRIGGYNFQWAWASGYVAGLAASAMLSAAAKPS